jgi:hypothetical protein
LIRKSSEILISSLAKDDLSSLVVFNTKASELAPLSHHHDETLQQLAPETMGRIAGNTDISSGLIAAARQLKEADDEEYHKVLILLSDGEHNTGEAPVDIADEIKNSGNVQLISIIALRDMGFLGNIMGASPAVSQIFAPFSAEGKETMKAIASSAKDYKEAANSELLKKSFTTIKEELCRK